MAILRTLQALHPDAGRVAGGSPNRYLVFSRAPEPIAGPEFWEGCMCHVIARRGLLLAAFVLALSLPAAGQEVVLLGLEPVQPRRLPWTAQLRLGPPNQL